MTHTPALVLKIMLPLVYAACGAFGQPSVAGWHKFVSTVASYVVYYPESWYILQPDLRTLYIINFPPSQRVKAVVLPEGGASIAIVPPPNGATTIEEWIRRDGTTRTRVSRVFLTITTMASSKPLPVTEVMSQWGDTREESEEVDSYFEISGHLFGARLIYWKGDPSREEYRRVLHKMLETITLTDTTRP